MKNFTIVITIGIACLLGLLDVFPVSAAPYSIIAIQPLAGHNRTQLRGINNKGDVVGRSFYYDAGSGEITSETAIFWSSNGGLKALPSLAGKASAWGLSNGNLASGTAKNANGNDRAGRWDVAASEILDLGTLKDPTTQNYGESSIAFDLNDAGEVVGQADIWGSELSPFHAFYYDDDLGMIDIGTFVTGVPEYQNGYSIAYSINNIGQVVGIASNQDWSLRPFFYKRDTGLQQLAIDPVYPAQEWYATVINDSGLIGGHVITAPNRSKPYYWNSNSANPVAIQMPSGFPYGEISGINKYGQMVGMMWDNDGATPTYHAFIFDQQNGVRDLNALIDPSTWVLNYARDINDFGQIVGAGYLDGARRGFRLTLTNQRDGDVNSDGIVNLKDAILSLQVINNQAQGKWAFSGADVNGDGKIGLADGIFILRSVAGI